ncbi:MAG: DUF2806 domain-containing protein [Anaerolineae bacterium]|nr:DUF2806 domain-containing protein [Anaerolineae bacterium]
MDIVGIGKLIETLGSFVRDFTDPYFKNKLAKSMTDAETYRIEELSKAVHTVKQKYGVDIAYQGGQPSINIQQDEYVERAITSWIDNQLRQQRNRETIIAEAAHQLELVPDISEEKVDPDWVTRFFNYSQDVSDKEMQLLWAKILAGEVAQPISFSLRTLDSVKSLTRQEAEVFSRAAQLALVDGSDENNIFPFIIDFYSANVSTEFSKITRKLNMSYLDILNLKSIGLILPDKGSEITFVEHDEITQTSTPQLISLNYGKNTVVLDLSECQTPSGIPVLGFSQVGMELLKLVDIQPNEAYLYTIARFLEPRGIKVSYSPSGVLDKQ